MRGSVADVALVRTILEERRIDAVLHFAAHKSVEESIAQPARYFANNVSGSLALLEAMAEAGVGHFVFSSTCAVYGEPPRVPIDESAPTRPENPYGETKLLVERALGYRTLSSSENSLVSLFVLIAVAQGLALPASILVYNLEPRLVPVVFAATNGGHFLPYSWLHGTRAYIGLAVVAALGPFAAVVAAGTEVAFHASGFIAGAALLAAAAWVRVSTRGV